MALWRILERNTWCLGSWCINLDSIRRWRRCFSPWLLGWRPSSGNCRRKVASTCGAIDAAGAPTKSPLPVQVSSELSLAGYCHCQIHLNVQLSTWIIKFELESETGWNEDQDPCWFELTFFSNIGVLCDTLTSSYFLNYDIPTVRKSAAHNQQCRPQAGWHNTPYSQTKQPNPKTHHTDAWSRNSSKPLTPPTKNQPTTLSK